MVTRVNNKQYNFFLFIGLAIILVSLPFLFAHRVFFLTNRLAILFVTLLWMSRAGFIAGLKALKNNYLLLAFILMYCIELIGLIYSSNYAAAFSSLERKLPLLLIPLIVMTSDDLGTRKLNLLLKYFAGSVTLASAICLIYAIHRNNYTDVFHNPNWFYFSYYDLTEILDIQPIYFSLFTSLSFFVIFFFIKVNWGSGSRLDRLLDILWAFYLFVFLFLLSGKTSIAATVLILMAITLFYFKSRGRLVVGLLMVAVIVAGSGILINKLPIVKERFLEALGMNKTSIWVYGDPERTQAIPEARLIKWEAALRIARDNWLIGVGSGDVQDELNMQYHNLNFQAGIDEKFNTHNQFLQTLAGSGMVGLFFLLATLILDVVKSIKNKNHLYLALIAIFCACFMTESMLERQFGILLFALVSSLFYHTAESDHFKI